MNIFIGKDGKQLGPFTEDQLRSMFESGMLTASDLAWQEGWPDWTPLWQLFGMPPPLTSHTPPPTVDPVSKDEPWTWICGGWAAFFLSLLPGKMGYVALVHLVLSMIVLFCSKSAKARWHGKALLCCSAGVLVLGIVVVGVLAEAG
ncbi:DUF4339 domain-containing protein [Luteolibacter sp. LG18]|uniref:DUF4339 domain-containing protein n=1 Tax=Luteolibacter sp. LG18 TaxID=2819286 RepID=UPI002B28E1BC|nr:hypothetical protein llg_43070 [Luteolibacter sp. LG18]